MQEFLNDLLPNVMTKLPDFYRSIEETLVMLIWSGVIALTFGLFFGIILIVTKKGGIFENKIIFHLLDKTINILRSIPFIILLFALIPLTRLVAGTAIGVEGAILPLVFGTVPFYARQIETALSELNPGLIEAAV